jgi:signal transduction histidine kinase
MTRGYLRPGRPVKRRILRRVIWSAAMRWIRNPLLLALSVFAVILVPSILLGWLSLRAVQSERAAARQRLIEDQERYARFAARAVRAELEALESAWEALVPRAVGWESRLDDLRASLDAARGQAFVRGSHVLHVSGRRLYPASDPPPAVLRGEGAVPDAAEAERLRGLLAAGEAGELDTGDTGEALRAYRRLLARAATPNLRAIAHAGIGRVQLQRGDPEAAIRTFEELLRLHPDARDLDNQPLRVHAQLGIARALESSREPLKAARTLTALYADLARHSDEIGSLQYEILVERIEGQMARLVPRPVPPEWVELERSFAAARARPKKQIGSSYFVHKLSRKLLRASLEGLPYSTPLRYLSDSVDGKPFLLAYLFLPDARGTAVAGLAGLEIDLQALSSALLPEILRRLEPAADLGLAVRDESGHTVIGGPDAAAATSVVTGNLGVPFDFWNVAVFRRPAADTDAVSGFRSRLYLYLVLLLLVSILAGTGLGVAALRRQTRLASLKTSFVSNVSHELRTPLTSIRLYTEMLEMGGDGMASEARASSLGTIRRECERLQRLIDELLDFVRIERGIKQYRLEYEEMGPLVRGVAEEFRMLAESEGYRYEVSIEPDLPELRVDADAVRQMLLNLLSNAVKYSDSEREIVVRAFRRDAELGLQVEDRGVGIEPAEQQRIFEEFYRVDTRLSSPRSGVGLGLTLVRRLAEAHGGRVSVESERGRGSRFTVWLPLASAPDPASRAAGDGLAEAGGG